MNTPNKAYVTKISSGTILAILAFSGLLLIIPIATPVLAANASVPTISVTGNNPALGNTALQAFTVKVSNPASNQFTVTAVSISMPTGWTATGCTDGGYLVACNVGAGGAGITWTVSTFTIGTGAGIPPGTFDDLAFQATSAAGTYPFTSTFTSKIQDASSVSYYTGPSFNVLVIDPTTTITAVTPAASANYVAGSAALTETATITPAQAGVPIVFTAPDYAAGTTYSFTPATATTNSAGTATTTFQPSNVVLGGVTTIEASVGTSTVVPECSGDIACGAAPFTITTVNGAPTQITWAFAASAANGNHYITSEATTTNGVPTFTGAFQPAAGVTFSLADKFANPVSLAGLVTAWKFTLTALSGGGVFDAPAATVPSLLTCSNGANWFAGATNLGVPCPVGAGPYVLPFDYYQSGTYNAIGELNNIVSGTYNGAAFAGAGTSAQLITSAFTAASPIPVAIPPTGTTLATVPAGDNVNVTAIPTPPSTCGAGAALCPPQAGVPVQLYLDQVTSYDSAIGAMDYGAFSSPLVTVGFAGGVMSTQVTTNANGQASALFTLSTCALTAPASTNCPTGAHAFFQSNATQITDTSSNALLISGDSVAPAITVAAAPFAFAGIPYYATDPLATTATHAATSGPLYLDVIISDKYGNLATNTAATSIQITLAASCGSSCPLSATTLYIEHSMSDTYATFGAVTWTMPSTTGTVTLTASGVLSGVQKTSTPVSIGVVSPNPTLAITSPAPQSGVIYSSNTAVVFNGQANTSIGYAATGPEAVTIASVTYKIDSGAVQTVPISMAYDTTFAVAATFTAGLHHITFNATDSLGNSVTGQTYSVLVDTAAPTVAFTTKTGASVGAGHAVNATIIVAGGDLNATSVVATVNGTALAASDVTVTGSNNLGHSVTYTVMISGLTAGHDNLGLSAKSLAGLTGTATVITVTVTVPFSQSVIISSAAYGTLGSFNGVSVTANNVWSSSQSLVVFAVWKNSAGQTVAVTTGGLTLASGATGTTFAPLAGALSSGTYTVNVFVITTSNNPVSSTTTISASQ